MKNRLPLFAVVIASMTCIDAPAYAKGGYKHDAKHKATGNYTQAETRQNIGTDFSIGDGDRKTIYEYYTTSAVSCPPYGMRKRKSSCMPAGNEINYRKGDMLSINSGWEPLPQPLLGRVNAAPSGSRYVRVGQDIYLVNSSTGEIYDHVYLGAM